MSWKPVGGLGPTHGDSASPAGSEAATTTDGATANADDLAGTRAAVASSAGSTWLPGPERKAPENAAGGNAERPSSAAGRGGRWLPPELAPDLPTGLARQTGPPPGDAASIGAGEPAIPSEPTVASNSAITSQPKIPSSARPRQHNGLRGPLVAGAAALAAILAATGGALILTHRAANPSSAKPAVVAPTAAGPKGAGPTAASPRGVGPTAASPAGVGPAASGPGAAARVHGLATPFVVDGSRFAVFAGVTGRWTDAARTIRLPAGGRLVFVEVLARRLAGPAVDLAALHFRVVGGGPTATPVAGVGSGSQAFGGVVDPTVNRLVVDRLAFVVRTGKRSLQLHFDPTNAGGHAVAVRLGG